MVNRGRTVVKTVTVVNRGRTVVKTVTMVNRGKTVVKTVTMVNCGRTVVKTVTMVNCGRTVVITVTMVNRGTMVVKMVTIAASGKNGNSGETWHGKKWCHVVKTMTIQLHTTQFNWTNNMSPNSIGSITCLSIQLGAATLGQLSAGHLTQFNWSGVN